MRRSLPDFIPYFSMLVYAIYRWIDEYYAGLQVRTLTVAGLLILAITGVIFFFSHRLAVLLMFAAIMAGISGAIGFSPAVYHSGINLGNISIRFGDPVFFLFLLLMVVFCFRHLEGILTKNYWRQIRPLNSQSHGQ